MSELYITGFAAIDQHTFLCNGKKLCVKQKEATTNDWLKFVYESLTLNYMKFFRMDHLCQAGILLAEALVQSSVFLKQYAPENIALVLANSVSSLESDRTFQRTIADEQEFFPSPAVFVYTLPNIVLGEISIRHQFRGENLFMVSSEFNAAEISSAVQILFDKGKADCCMAGWLEVDENNLRALLCIVEKKQSEISNLRFEKSQLETLFNRTKP